MAFAHFVLLVILHSYSRKKFCRHPKKFLFLINPHSYKNNGNLPYIIMYCKKRALQKLCHTGTCINYAKLIDATRRESCAVLRFFQYVKENP